MRQTSSSAAQAKEDHRQSGRLAVEFLYWEDCPSHERALELLTQALREEDIAAELQMYRVETDEEAEEIGFPGSPTIRVNGVDIDENPDLPIGLSCRVYRTETGRMSPLPSKEKIARALHRAAARSDSARARSEFLPCR
jgi:hypothetical protein